MATPSTSPQDKQFFGGHMPCFLEFDGQMAGHLHDCEGGDQFGVVANERIGPERWEKKHIAQVMYRPIEMTFAPHLNKRIFEWVRDTMDGKFRRVTGSVIHTNYDYKEVSRLEFTEALFTEFELPLLDASAKDAAHLKLKLFPETTKRIGGAVKGVINAPKTKAKMFLPSNFRFEIKGPANIGAACKYVSRIEPITVTQQVAQDISGQDRDYLSAPEAMRISDLVITVAESHAEPFYKWHEDFVVEGNNAPENEVTATLDYVTPDLKGTILSLELKGVGIHSIKRQRPKEGADAVRKIQVEMYCEEIKFTKIPEDK